MRDSFLHPKLQPRSPEREQDENNIGAGFALFGKEEEEEAQSDIVR